MRRLRIALLAGLFAVSGLNGSGRAQSFSVVAPTGGGGAFVATATVEEERTADRMRVVFPLTAQGKTVQSALEAMNEKVEVVKVQLGTLGADEESIRLSQPGVDAGISDAHRKLLEQMQQMQGGGFGGGLGGGRFTETAEDDEEDSGAASLISVRADLTADWKLMAEDIAAVLEESHRVRTAIRELNFNEDVSSELSPEEEELLEEATMYGESEYEASSEPTIVFLSQITPDVRARLLQAAFAKARERAESIATAVGSQLGPLSSAQVTNSASGMPDYSEIYGMRDDSVPLSIEDRESNVSGKEPTGLSLTIHVMVSYEPGE